MKKNLFIPAVLFITIISLAVYSVESEDMALGEEYIQPLRYPKSSATFEYTMLRNFHGFGSENLKTNLPDNLGVALSFEAGLYKYLNAGALFSASIAHTPHRSAPTHMRMSLFAKPYIPIGDRVSFFSRLGGGLTVSFLNYLVYFNSNKASYSNFNSDIFGAQEYALFPFGGNIMATIGVEYFPFSRVGLAFECGFRGDFIYAKKSHFLTDLGVDATKKDSPNSFSYLVYELPLMLTLQVIF